MGRTASSKAYAHKEEAAAAPAPQQSSAPTEEATPAVVEVVEEDPGELSEEEPTNLEQTPREVLDDDMGDYPQPSQSPNVLVESDEGAEG